MSRVHCGAAGKANPSDPSKLVSRHHDTLPVLPGAERRLLLTNRTQIQSRGPKEKEEEKSHGSAIDVECQGEA